MTREEKINAIYKVMANKELNFGCKILIQDEKHDFTVEYMCIDSNKYYKDDDFYEADEIRRKEDWEVHTVIWHDVMFWDVLDYILGLTGDDLSKNNLFIYWKELRQPIENQSEECINYIYSLAK